MIRKTQFMAFILILIVTFSGSTLVGQAALQTPDIGIDYDVPTEVKADQYVHLPGPIDMTEGGTSGRKGYGYVLMPTDLPDKTELTVSQLHDVDFVTDTNEGQITRCGEAYVFDIKTPDGTSYHESFSITLPYCNGLMDPDIYTYDDDTDLWTRQDGTFDYTFFDITTELPELAVHGVFSTEQLGGEIEDGNELEEELEDDNEMEDQNHIDDPSQEVEVTLPFNEELTVYANQIVFRNNENDQVAVEDKDSTTTEETAEADEINEMIEMDEDDEGIRPFTWILLGVILITIGSVFLIFKKRKKD